MATRLPVVISQSVRREPAAVNCEEQLITELLFTSGLDATLIGPLESIESGSTDHLCLEGLKGPFALLSWASLANSQQQLSRLGIHGSIIDRDSDPRVGRTIETSGDQVPNRRIDYFQLNTDRAASVWIESLKKILEVQEVKAFSIQNAVRPSKPSVAITTQTQSHSYQEGFAKETVAAKNIAKPPVVAKKPIDLNDEEEVWAHLDELVDDLDQADV
jgi:hypothetical protein